MTGTFRPTVGCLFRYIFGSPDSTDILKPFLNAILHDTGSEKITAVKILNPFDNKKTNDEFESTIEVSAAGAAGRLYRAAVRILPNIGSLEENLGRMFGNMTRSGHGRQAEPQIIINILDFILFPEGRKSHYYFSIDEQGASESGNCILSLHFLELPGSAHARGRDDPNAWLRYLLLEGTASTELFDLIKCNPRIAGAHRRYREFTANGTMRDLYLRHDSFGCRETGYRAGFREGNPEKPSRCFIPAVPDKRPFPVHSGPFPLNQQRKM